LLPPGTQASGTPERSSAAWTHESGGAVHGRDVEFFTSCTGRFEPRVPDYKAIVKQAAESISMQAGGGTGRTAV